MREAAALLLLALAGCAHTEPPSPTVAFAAAQSGAPALRYARLDRVSCEAELTQRHVPWTPVDSARGVLAPGRLTGPLHGVVIHSALPERQRAEAPIEILDCRLALALDDFTALLARHGVTEIVHMSMYRPPPRSWPSGRIARRHPGGLALDAGRFVRKDGSVLDVEKDFHGRIGAPTCGPNTGPQPATPEAVELRTIVCETAQERLFNVELTPDFNWKHRNHFHLEVTANVGWFIVH